MEEYKKAITFLQDFIHLFRGMKIGYIMHKVIKFASICGKCKIAIEHNDDSPARENSTLVELKEFKAGALCRPSQKAYDFIHKIEELFRTRTGSSFMELPDAVGVLE
ncbi:hypothetical protein ABVT39_019248 [Epinephelus coioides]